MYMVSARATSPDNYSNLYVRAGISSNPEKLLSLPSVQGYDSAELQIRQPFTFEFLGLKAQEIVDEHDLEDALITHLQEFILELGKGFCFEARQKRIIIDNAYYYPDLVFETSVFTHCLRRNQKQRPTPKRKSL